jgi:hypothetical protein
MTCSENNSSTDHSAAVSHHLQAMSKLDNIPRKEKQFVNFMVNSFGGGSGGGGRGSRQKGPDGLLDTCHQLWTILQQEKDRRRKRNNTTQMEQTQQEQQEAEKTLKPLSSAPKANDDETETDPLDGIDVNHHHGVTTTSNHQPPPESSHHPSATTTKGTNHVVGENGRTSTTTNAAKTTKLMNTSLDTKKVHRAVKKALKKAPNHSMSIKALRKVLIQDYGVVVVDVVPSQKNTTTVSKSVKAHLQHVIQSYRKVKIDGKVVSLR